MSKIISRVFLSAIVAAIVFSVCNSTVDSKVVGNNGNGNSGSNNGNNGRGLEIKTFQGILTGPGNAGTLDKDGYIDFRCDPKLYNWHIQVKGYSASGKGNGNNTHWFGDPGVCDHVEVVMYYDPYGPLAEKYGYTHLSDHPYDGIAISVRKIP